MTLDNIKGISVFEAFLIAIGAVILGLGYFLITTVLKKTSYAIGWEFVQSVFLWALLVIFIVLIAIIENGKRDLLLSQTAELKGINEKLAVMNEKMSVPKLKK
ncbi:hypothetical protein J4206_03485 [Candidatus Woesearchaeota archaeon]|nr:hypothetical protein [Candidatus Woesearchaeota archaeon]